MAFWWAIHDGIGPRVPVNRRSLLNDLSIEWLDRSERVIARLFFISVGLLAALLTLVVVRKAGGTIEVLGWCVGCWIDRAGANETGVVVVAGSAATSKTVETWLSAKFPLYKAWKKVSGPAKTVADVYDLASQDTPEAQATTAAEKYKNLIGTAGADPGSTGDELNKAIDRVVDFGTGKIKLE